MIILQDEYWEMFVQMCVESGCYKGCELPESLKPNEGKTAATASADNEQSGGETESNLPSICKQDSTQLEEDTQIHNLSDSREESTAQKESNGEMNGRELEKESCKKVDAIEHITRVLYSNAESCRAQRQNINLQNYGLQDSAKPNGQVASQNSFSKTYDTKDLRKQTCKQQENTKVELTRRLPNQQQILNGSMNTERNNARLESSRAETQQSNTSGKE